MTKNFLKLIAAALFLSLLLSGCTFAHEIGSFEIDENTCMLSTEDYDIYKELISNRHTTEYFRTNCREIRHVLVDILYSAHNEGVLYYSEDGKEFPEGKPALTMTMEGKEGVWYLTAGDKYDLVRSQVSSFIVTVTREEIVVNDCRMYVRSDDGKLWYDYSIEHMRVYVDLRPVEIMKATLKIYDAYNGNLLLTQEGDLSGEDAMAFYASLKVRYKDVLRAEPSVMSEPQNMTFLQAKDLDAGSYAIGFNCTGSNGGYFGSVSLMRNDQKGNVEKIAQDIFGIFELDEFVNQ